MESGATPINRSGGASRRAKSTRTSSSSSVSASKKICKCNLGARLLTSTTLLNPGRRFWRCPNWNNNEDCGNFRWHDVGLAAAKELEYDGGQLDDYVAQLDDYVAVDNERLKKKNARLKEKLVAERKKGKRQAVLWIVVYLVSFVGFMSLIGNCKCNG